MPRTEVYQLRLTKDEKDELARRAKMQGVSIAKLIRQKLNLDTSKWDSEWSVKTITAKDIEAGVITTKKVEESTIPAWKKLLPPS